jgi:hypothetical protein
MPSGPHIAIGAALRRRCGLRAGDRLLLAAKPNGLDETVRICCIQDGEG